ncbi:MAG: hypothetical protein Q9170_001197 [Blastenia crenularia]
MDPHTNTRGQFTNYLSSIPFPDFAAPVWKAYFTRHQVLLEKLAHHPAMVPNLQQTYKTPANSKIKSIFSGILLVGLWYVVDSFFFKVDPSLQNLSKEAQEMWLDAVGRATFTKMLILDTKPGTLNIMTETAYPDQRGQNPEFGEEILELARHLDD